MILQRPEEIKDVVKSFKKNGERKHSNRSSKIQMISTNIYLYQVVPFLASGLIFHMIHKPHICYGGSIFLNYKLTLSKPDKDSSQSGAQRDWAVGY